MMAVRLSSGPLLPLLLASAVVMRVASPLTADLSYMLLAAIALLGRAQAIQALFISWLFSMLSPGLAPEVPTAWMGRYAVLAMAALSVLLRSRLAQSEPNFRVSKMAIGTMIVGCSICVHAVLVSPLPDISVLKAISWTVVSVTLIAAWGGLPSEARDSLGEQIFWALVVLMLLSALLLPLPVGYLRNGSGFQGILAHPQAFGPTMGLLAAWAGGRLVAERRPSWWLLGVFSLSLVMVLLSAARTAGIASLLGLALAAVSGSLLAGQSILAFLPGLRSPRVPILIAVTLLAGVLGSSFLTDRLDRYLSKGGDSSDLFEAYDRSRGGLMDRMLGNIRENPVRGIGFGIASDPQSMEVSRDPILGLPVGAPIEKGVLPLAVLEELGVGGLIVVGLWILATARRGARGGGVSAVSVLFAALLMNMGEAVLFSVGGMGLLILILITWAATSNPKGLRTTNA